MATAWLTVALWCWYAKGIAVTARFATMEACQARADYQAAIQYADPPLCWCDVEREA